MAMKKNADRGQIFTISSMSSDKDVGSCEHICTRMRDPMKTKNFYVAIVLIVISLVTIWVTISPTPAIDSIVRVTHKKISKLKNLKPVLKKLQQEVEVNEAYLELLGFSSSAPKSKAAKEKKENDQQAPVVASSVFPGELNSAVHLLKTAQKYLPNNLVVFFNLGLDFDELEQLRNHCNTSSSCVIKQFVFSDFPSHVQYKYLQAYRPLCIQTALRDYGAVIWVDNSMYFISDELSQALRKAEGVGLAGWAISNPTSSLTHYKMFEYFKTIPTKYYFHHAVKSTHLVIYNTAMVHKEIMLPWVKCALSEDCINPRGAQNTGCNYDRRPFFLYSGCHHYDMSALNVILGLLFDFNSAKYSCEAEVFGSRDKSSSLGGRNFSAFRGEIYRLTN